ncbi:MAG TPA: calcium-binding protein, partial [Solirubrobacterales bacterium]|nr:calcium-binding protein [Solirubrobacterales bacterium]
AALEALPGVGNVTVTGGPGGAGGDNPYTITFTGGTNFAQIVANNVDLSGGGAFAAVHTIRNGGTTAPPDTQCATATSGNCGAGKAWVYAGEDIAGSDPAAILETPLYSVQNPFPTTSGNEFGGNVFRLGDTGSRLAASGGGLALRPDGRPEFVVADRNVGYPLTNPDTNLFPNVGVAYLFNGDAANNGSSQPRLLTLYPHPEPQARATFSASFNSGRPAGDLGLSGEPDVVIGAPLQNNLFADDGTAYVLRGDVASVGGGGQGGWQFAQMDDPTPITGGGFGSSTTGVGDLVGGPSGPANEMMIGSWAPFDPFTEPVTTAVGDVHIVNPQTGTNLQTIRDPSGEGGSGFGVSMTPMGDLNNDGFLDFGITAYLSDAVGAAAGRAYILYSDNTPPPTPAAELASGRCANERMGTEGADTLQGTAMGDTLFALGGNDSVSGLGEEDCLDGAAGRDSVDGGTGDDSLLGGGARDRLTGGVGADRLFGEGGKDKMIGGPGKDFLAGGKHRDKIKVKGGGADEVNCGKGKDLVIASRSDEVSANCELVKG